MQRRCAVGVARRDARAEPCLAVWSYARGGLEAVSSEAGDEEHAPWSSQDRGPVGGAGAPSGRLAHPTPPTAWVAAGGVDDAKALQPR